MDLDPPEEVGVPPLPAGSDPASEAVLTDEEGSDLDSDDSEDSMAWDGDAASISSEEQMMEWMDDEAVDRMPPGAQARATTRAWSLFERGPAASSYTQGVAGITSHPQIQDALSVLPKCPDHLAPLPSAARCIGHRTAHTRKNGSVKDHDDDDDHHHHHHHDHEPSNAPPYRVGADPIPYIAPDDSHVDLLVTLSRRPAPPALPHDAAPALEDQLSHFAVVTWLQVVASVAPPPQVEGPAEPLPADLELRHGRGCRLGSGLVGSRSGPGSGTTSRSPSPSPLLSSSSSSPVVPDTDAYVLAEIEQPNVAGVACSRCGSFIAAYTDGAEVHLYSLNRNPAFTRMDDRHHQHQINPSSPVGGAGRRRISSSLPPPRPWRLDLVGIFTPFHLVLGYWPDAYMINSVKFGLVQGRERIVITSQFDPPGLVFTGHGKVRGEVYILNLPPVGATADDAEWCGSCLPGEKPPEGYPHPPWDLTSRRDPRGGGYAGGTRRSSSDGTSTSTPAPLYFMMVRNTSAAGALRAFRIPITYYGSELPLNQCVPSPCGNYLAMVDDGLRLTILHARHGYSNQARLATVLSLRPPIRRYRVGRRPSDGSAGLDLEQDGAQYMAWSFDSTRLALTLDRSHTAAVVDVERESIDFIWPYLDTHHEDESETEIEHEHEKVKVKETEKEREDERDKDLDHRTTNHANHSDIQKEEDSPVVQDPHGGRNKTTATTTGRTTVISSSTTTTAAAPTTTPTATPTVEHRRRRVVPRRGRPTQHTPRRPTLAVCWDTNDHDVFYVAERGERVWSVNLRLPPGPDRVACLTLPLLVWSLPATSFATPAALRALTESLAPIRPRDIQAWREAFASPDPDFVIQLTRAHVRRHFRFESYSHPGRLRVLEGPESEILEQQHHHQHTGGAEEEDRPAGWNSLVTPQNTKQLHQTSRRLAQHLLDASGHPVSTPHGLARLEERLDALSQPGGELTLRSQVNVLGGLPNFDRVSGNSNNTAPTTSLIAGLAHTRNGRLLVSTKVGLTEWVRWRSWRPDRTRHWPLRFKQAARMILAAIPDGSRPEQRAGLWSLPRDVLLMILDLAAVPVWEWQGAEREPGGEGNHDGGPGSGSGSIRGRKRRYGRHIAGRTPGDGRDRQWEVGGGGGGGGAGTDGRRDGGVVPSAPAWWSATDWERNFLSLDRRRGEVVYQPPDDTGIPGHTPRVSYASDGVQLGGRRDTPEGFLP